MALYKCTGAQRLDEENNPLCSYTSDKPWTGRCPGCGGFYNWVKLGADPRPKEHKNAVTAGDSVDVKVEYIATGVESFDHVLSGGLVKGNTILFGGVHGGGKSSLLMEVCDRVVAKTKRPAVFASSEQSTAKVLEICDRLDIVNEHVKIISTKNIHEVLQYCAEVKPLITVFDSLQNFRFNEDMPATARETDEIGSLIVKHTQDSNSCSIVINQMSKDLTLKGGTAMPHLVETEMFLYRFDEEQDKKAMRRLLSRETRRAIREGEIDGDKLRVLICGKNRNGEENVRYFYMMTAQGLKPMPQLDTED